MSVGILNNKNLTAINCRDISAETTAVVNALYAHIPFCAKKCVYCAFYSAPPSGDIMWRYCRALIKEIEHYRDILKHETIFFGGGTPSLLDFDQWKYILQALEKFGFLPADEFTIECNPATVSLNKVKLWKDYGVNRISIGAQSFDDATLKLLGRIHTKEAIFKTFDLFRSQGFENINIDLMFGIPQQTLESWQNSVKTALSLNCEHLACYELTPEEDTEFLRLLSAGKYKMDEELACAMYDTLVELAESAGVFRYEVSNFARNGSTEHPEIPEFACKHNINYWRGGAYCGVGASASGFVNGVRYTNMSDTEKYCALLESGKMPEKSIDKLTPFQRAGEIAAFGLRMTSGWNFEYFRQVTGFDLRVHWKREMDYLIKLNYAVADEKSFRLTPQGLRFADWAGELFLVDQVLTSTQS